MTVSSPVVIDRENTGDWLRQVGPDLYRMNAFRVTGLMVDDQPREIVRHLEGMEISQRLGRDDYQPGPLSMQPPPDPDAVREARQRLTDPQRRIIDELFWFWPEQFGQCANDRAFHDLARNDVQAAVQTWVERESRPGKNAVAMHNLAVISHMLALDLEYVALDRHLSPDEQELRDSYWAAAYSRWKALMASGTLVERLSESMARLDDPRVTSHLVRRIQESLPLALISINAQLAVSAAQHGQQVDAYRHLQLIDNAGFGERLTDRAMRHATASLREHIKLLCKRAEMQSDQDPTGADQTLRELVSETAPLLEALDWLLPVRHPARDGVHNEVALCALALQIRFGNNTEDWKTSLGLLTLILPIASSESVRARIRDNRDIVQDNLLHQSQNGG